MKALSRFLVLAVVAGTLAVGQAPAFAGSYCGDAAQRAYIICGSYGVKYFTCYEDYPAYFFSCNV